MRPICSDVPPWGVVTKGVRVIRRSLRTLVLGVVGVLLVPVSTTATNVTAHSRTVPSTPSADASTEAQQPVADPVPTTEPAGSTSEVPRTGEPTPAPETSTIDTNPSNNSTDGTVLGTTPGTIAPATVGMDEVQLSGAVSGPDGTRLAGVVVTASFSGVVDSSTTDALGGYALVAPANSSVTLSAGVGSAEWIPEYFDNVASASAATPIALGVEPVTINFQLDRRHRVTGLVTLPGGELASGATVVAEDEAGTVVASTITAPDGSFELWLLPGAFRVYATPPEGVSAAPTYIGGRSVVSATLFTAEPNGTTVSSVQLPPLATLRGIVSDSGGTGLAGVTVTIFTESGSFIRSVVTVGDGAYDFGEVAESPVKVGFEASAGSPFVSDYYPGVDTLGEATAVILDGPAVINHTLVGTSQLRGVVMLENAAAAAGVTVSLTKIGGTGGGRTVETAIDGSYSFLHVQPGTYRVCFTPPVGSMYLFECAYGASSGSGASPVEVAPDSDIEVNTELSLGGSISGVVADTSGVALANVWVVARASGAPAVGGYSGTDGHYSIPAIRPGSYSVSFEPSATTNFFIQTYDSLVGVTKGQHTEGIDAALTKGAQISGTVTTEAGVPAAYVPVDARSAGGYSAYGWTDSNGEYVVHRLQAGTYRLSVASYAYSGVRTESVAVELGGSVGGMDIVVSANPPPDPTTASIAGTVRDPDGAPVDGVRVSVYSRSTVTDSNGTYVLDNLSAGTYRPSFERSGFVPNTYSTDVRLAEGEHVGDIDMVLQRGATIRGVVTTEDGRPVPPNTYLHLREAFGNNARVERLSGDGHYELTDIAAGDYTVEVNAGGPENPYLSEFYPNVRQQENAEVVTLSIEEPTTINAMLELGGSISGSATTSGQAVRNVGVSIIDSRGGYVGSARTDTNGDYSVVGLVAGQYVVRFDPPSGVNLLTEFWDGAASESAASPVHVVEGVGSHNIDATLEPGLSFEGTVTGPMGEVVSGGWVYVTEADVYDGGMAESSRVDSSGHFLVGGLHPGSFCVYVSPDDVRYQGRYAGPTADSCTWLVLVDQSASLNVVLEASPSVSGRVTDVDGQPLAGIAVEAGTVQTTTDAQGQYKLYLDPWRWQTLRFSDFLLNLFTEAFWPGSLTEQGAGDVILMPREQLTGYDIVMHRPGFVHGKVLDDAGAPVQGVRVILDEDHWTVTDAAGEYRIGFSQATTGVLRFEPQGGSGLLGEYFHDSPDLAGATSITVDIDQSVQADATLAPDTRPRSSISGLVTLPSGAPAYGVTVSAALRGMDEWTSVRTRPDGRYDLAGLLVGEYDVRFEADEMTVAAEYYNSAYRREESTPVTLGPGPLLDLDAQLSDTQGTVDGSVSGPAGEPVADVTVEVCPVTSYYWWCETAGNTQTDDAGHYSIALLPGEYTVRFSPADWTTGYIAEGYHDQDTLQGDAIVVHPGELTRVDETLERHGRIVGTVRGPAGAVVGSEVTATTSWGEGVTTTTDSEGHYELQTFGDLMMVFATGPEGSGLGTTWYGGTSMYTATRINVPRGTEETVDLILADAGMGTISGMISAHGKPLPFACVNVGFLPAIPSFDEADDFCTTHADELGNYEIGGLVDGDYVVCAPSYGSIAGECNGEAASAASGSAATILDGSSEVVNLDLGGGGSLLGSYPPGALTGGLVKLYESGMPREGRSGLSRDGLVRSPFAFYGLKPALYRIEWVNDDGSTVVLADRVAVVAGESTILRLPSESPPRAPGAPLAPTTASGDSQVTVTWNPPADNGSPITDYVVQYSADGSAWADVNDGEGTATSHVVAGLLNDTPYSFRVAAANAVGLGDFSPASAPVFPGVSGGVPSAPSAPVVAAGDDSVSLSWTPGPDNGSAVTDFLVQVSSDSSNWTTFADGVSIAPSALVTGLSNGTSYVFRVAAVNALGAGAYSALSSAVTPRTTPSAPFGLLTTAGDGQVSLSWTAASDGGSPIVDYVIDRSNDGGVTWAEESDGVSTLTSMVVSGLTNGTPYVFRVSAVNGAGRGYSSAPSAATTPSGRPLAPAAPSGVSRDRRVSLSWAAPADGGSPVVDYVVQYSATSGATWLTFPDAVSTEESTDVTGLINGTGYVFRVAGVNSNGQGDFSASSTTVIPRSTVPDAPLAPIATAGSTSVALTWTAPATGGSAITDYVVQFRRSSITSWTTFSDGIRTATTTIVSGLSNGVEYVFRVAARNAVGTGAFSADSHSATPRTVPSAPPTPRGTAGDRRVTLTWTAPATGGAPITGYVVQYRKSTATTWLTLADGTNPNTGAVVTGLTNGTSYVFRVAAVNVAGRGAYSPTTTSVKPRTVPSAPAAPRPTPGNARVSLAWTAPTNGGLAITDYVVQFRPQASGIWVTFADGVRSTTGATVTGLQNGTAYVFQVAARNAAGTGAFSPPSLVVIPRTLPSAPTVLLATVGSKQVLLAWTAPASDGGATITDYVVQFRRSSTSTWTTFADGTSTATSATVTGLTNGVAYYFRVAARNVAGRGAFATTRAAVKPHL